MNDRDLRKNADFPWARINEGDHNNRHVVVALEAVFDQLCIIADLLRASS